MNNRTGWLAVILPAVMYFFAACGGLSTQQQSATEKAITALRKLEATSQIKTSSYREYSQSVIEPKAQVNQAVAVLPDGDLKNELNTSMEAYIDAATAWKAMLGNNYLSADHEPGKTLSPKYQLNLSGPSNAVDEYNDAIESIGNPNRENGVTRVHLGKIWAVGKAHLDRASTLIAG